MDEDPLDARTLLEKYKHDPVSLIFQSSRGSEGNHTSHGGQERRGGLKYHHQNGQHFWGW
jgi:hypothetical protein